ncbi:hypothetical protein D3C78_1497560 [compost metagenome]
MRKASATTRGRSSTLRTSQLCLTIGMVKPNTSSSWNASVPSSGVATWPVMQTIGTESSIASAMPVTRFDAPGPEVATQTPTWPLARAKPLAASAAPCSWRTRMCFSDESTSAS